MELFNKYKNKNFTYMVNYINSCINNDSIALTEDQLKKDLLGSSQNTFEEFVDALLNKNPDGLNAKLPNAELLFSNDEAKLYPIRENYIPIRPSIAEKAWLYYVLCDHKSALFIDSTIRNQLIHSLENELTLPNIQQSIDIRELHNNSQALTIDETYIHTFKTIIDAITEHRELIVTNHAYSGDIYKNQKIIPYKLEYAPQFDSFSLSAYPLDTKRPVKMNLSNLSDVSLGEAIDNYEQFLTNFELLLKKTRIKEPIVLEISNDRNGYDRCSYKFSSYDKICYENETGGLIMKVYYYRFQKDEILRNILFLGPSVKILSPSDVVDDYLAIIKTSLEQYE